MRHFAGFAKFCGCQFLIRHSRIGQIGVLKCFDSGLFFLAPTLRGSFFLQTGLLCPPFFLLAFLPLCSLLCNDHLTVRLGSSLERRQGKYEKCDNSNGCGQPAPRNPAFRLLRFVLLRRRRKRKRWCFRNWFGFKRSWLLRHRLRHRRFYWYGRHRSRSFFVLCWLDGRGFLLQEMPFAQISEAQTSPFPADMAHPVRCKQKHPSRDQFSPHSGFQPERPQNHRPQAASRLSDRRMDFRRP